MNRSTHANYQQTGLTSKDVLTHEEIKKYEKMFTMQKVKKGAVVAVGTSTILISGVSANADVTSKIMSKGLFEEKVENTLVVAKSKKGAIEIVETAEEKVEEQTKAITKEKTVTTKPTVNTITLAEAKTTSEKAIETQIDTLAISEHETEFLNAIKEGAFESWKEYGILPSILTAQAVLESDWGTSELALYGNALFGVKASNWEGKTYTKRTREVYNGKEAFINAAFRAYDSWTDSMIDHGQFLNKERYALAIGEKDYQKSITAIFNGGYATDPEYVEKITTVIKNYQLDKWDTEVIGAYDAYIASIGPSDMDAFVHYLNNATSEKRLQKIANLTPEEAIATFQAVGSEAMKHWKNAEMESLFKAFQHENLNKFLHGNYENKYLDDVAALALVIIGEATPSKEQATILRSMEIGIEGQVNVGEWTLTDAAGIQAYVAFEEKINNIQEDYATVNVPSINANFSGKVIVLDSGHGGKDPGAPSVYANGKVEATYNLTLVQNLKNALEQQGATVYLTNDGSTYVELEQRVQFAVEKNADVFFSIHFNANDDRTAEGTEIFYNENSEESKQLAETLFPFQKQALHTLVTRSNGANTANYEVLRTANAYNLPAILTEALFVSNPYEVLLLENEQVKTSLVNGYVAGLADYFSLEKEEVLSTETISEETENTPSEDVPLEGAASEETPTETENTKKEEASEQTDTTSSPTAEPNERKESFFLFDLFAQ